MKIVVSYINSLYNPKKTIDLINNTNASGIHVDLMDGIYVGVKNFDIETLAHNFSDNNKPLDIHMMVESPSKYLKKLYQLNPECIYIHPKTEPGLIGILNDIASHEIKKGIVINPNEDILEFSHYYALVNRVLLMSVVPGKGGQEFLSSTVDRLKKLKDYQKNNNFEIFVDGGINDETIKLIDGVDGVVSGSFICKSENFNEQINKLMN